jgi:hypothetical protein
MTEEPKDESRKSEVVTIYGLSSEGYGVAANLASKGLEVYMIDETLGTAMELRPETAGDYRELRQLLSDEVLMSIKSSKECIARSKVVFFTPKMRRNDEDILAESRGRISEMAKYLSSGTLVLFCLPLGIAGTREIVERVERTSGLTFGKDFSFGYSPIDSGRPSVFGADSSLIDYAHIVEAAGFSMEIYGLQKAELVHAQKLVAKYSALASTFESAKRLVQKGFDCPREYKQIFSDDICGMLYDLRLVSESLETGDPILYLVSGSLKSIESYTRFLIERIRDFVRSKELKAARLRILLFTDHDQLEMRGDRIAFGKYLQDKLRDFYSDIELLNIMKEGFSLPMGMEKTNLMIFLSGSAEQKLMQLYEEQISMTRSHVIRANLPVEFVS